MSMPCAVLWALLLCLCGVSVGLSAAGHGIVDSVSPVCVSVESPTDGLVLCVAAGSGSTLRLSVRMEAGEAGALLSPSVDDKRVIPASHRVSWDGMQGVKTEAGALLVASSGHWQLVDRNNLTVLRSNGPISRSKGGVSVPVMSAHGSVVGPRQPCLGNGVFGPPFSWNVSESYFAFAVSAYDADPRSPQSVYVHCYPDSFDGQGWFVLGSSADFYLGHIDSGFAFASAYYELSGAAGVPPRYAFGFMATYWGYENMQYVVGNMSKFRHGRYPIDSFIMDYDWWRCDENPDLDFEYCPSYWFNQTFQPGNGIKSVVTETPADVLRYFHEGLGSEDSSTLRMRFGGIRKPRTYNHIDFCNRSKWLLPDSDSVVKMGGNWNFTIAGMRQWWSARHAHFLHDGIDFWWNDEGETQWFTYHFWNLAEQELSEKVRPNQRMFTLNRAFTPGMQRFPAVTWTGDMQDCSHTKALEFVRYGQPYFTCDLTSPDATVLLRQYQGAVMWPVMRVHAMHGVPRFPFYWGNEAHQSAFRVALETRYALIPTLYSLAHAQSRPPFHPMVHPASWVAGPPPKGASDSFMVGKTFVVAELSTAHEPDPNVNCSTAWLPPGIWYQFNTTRTVDGGRTVKRQGLALSEFPIYTRAGSIVCVQPFDRVVQHSASQGGLLEVQIYAGADAEFVLYEDDGITAGGHVRKTRWRWNNANLDLSWESKGPRFSNANDYTTARVALYTPNAVTVRYSKVFTIGKGGHIILHPHTLVD